MSLQRQFSAFVVIVALASLPTFVNADMHYSPDPDSCEIIGSTDLYGIGFRVGSYLNWAAISLALMLVPEPAIPTFISIQLVNTSIFICFFATVFQTGGNKAFLSLESWIVFKETILLDFNLVYTAFWICGSVERIRPILCLLAFTWSLLCFTLAYITNIGLVSGQREACLPLFDHTSKLVQIFMTVFLSLGGLIALGVCLWCSWRTFRCTRASRSPAYSHETSRHLQQIFGAWDSRINPVKAFFIIISVATGIASIVGLENILKRYDISTAEASFTSASQLNPFLMGLFNLIYVLFCSYEHGVAAWPLTHWCHEIRIWLDYLMHPSKIHSQSMC